MDDILEKMQSTIIASWDYGTDVAGILDTFDLPDLDEPDEPGGGCTRKETMKFDKLYGEFLNRESYLEENLKRLAHIILQFCTPMLKGKLQQFEGYTTAKTDGDVIWLLSKIRDVVYRVDHSKPKDLTLDDSLQAVIQYSQPRDMSVPDFVKKVDCTH